MVRAFEICKGEKKRLTSGFGVVKLVCSGQRLELGNRKVADV